MQIGDYVKASLRSISRLVILNPVVGPTLLNPETRVTLIQDTLIHALSGHIRLLASQQLRGTRVELNVGPRRACMNREGFGHVVQGLGFLGLRV